MKKISVGLFGFGRTGRIVAGELLNDKDFDLRWVVRRTSPVKLKFATDAFELDYDAAPIYNYHDLAYDFFSKNEVDIIIDFSSPTGYRHYRAAAERGIKIISAISSYPEKAVAALREYSKTTAVLYSPNITIGINFLMVAARMMQRIAPHADIEIVEEHFREKEEISGTAMKIASVLGLDPENIKSIRAGGIVGRHEVIFGLRNQTLRLTHESINKAAFGQGAIFAAKWLADKTNGFYTMEEIISSIIRESLMDARS